MTSEHCICCAECRRTFYVCASCYRGHKYCNDFCRTRGYVRARARARTKYNATFEAILDHRDRSQRYRMRRKIRALLKESVTDNTYESKNISLINPEVESFSPQNCCVVCGKSVFGPKGSPIEDLDL